LKFGNFEKRKVGWMRRRTEVGKSGIFEILKSGKLDGGGRRTEKAEILKF